MKKFSYIQLVCLTGFQVLLFLAFIIRLNEQTILINHNNCVLRINFPNDEPSENPNLKTFNGPDLIKEWKITKKKFIAIDLSGEKPEDEKRINFIRQEARRLKYTYDTSSIIKVHFTEENTYGQFVQLVSIMQKNLYKRYMLYKDDFYICGEAPPEPFDSSVIIRFLDY